ncbi:MAG: tape measure protein [Faecalibacterium sp.]|nr:tape measure protein [Faecalibacterium sp.]
MADFKITGDTSLDGSGLQQDLSSLTVAAGNLIADFARNVANALGQAVQAGINFNAQLETYTTNFTTMLGGSADAAQQLVGELQALGAATPLAITDLTNAAQTLLAFGAADAADMTDTLTMLGDVALGDAQKLQSLALAYGQMVSTGKLQGQDLLQMINAGFNPLQELSEMGYGTVADLKEKMSKGAISVVMVQAVFEPATSAGGNFYGAREAASHTFTGQLSTLEDNASALAGALTEGLTNQMSATLLPQANRMVEQLTDAFRENGIEGMLDAAAGMIEGYVSGLWEQLPTLLTTATDYAVEMIRSLAAGLQTGIPELLAQALPMMEQFTASLRENAGRLVDAGLELLHSVMSGLMAALPDLLAYAPQIIINLAGVINDNAPKILASGFSLIVQLITGILSAIPDLLAATPKIVEAIFSVIQAFNWTGLGRSIITGLKNGISAMVGAVKGAADGIFVTIRNAITGLPQSLLQIARNAISAVVNAFRGQNWASIGSNLINGVVSGIGSAIGGLVQAAANAAYSAFQAAKHALGIRSPSRKGKEEVGKPFVQGIAGGVEENADLVEQAGRASAEDMLAAARDTVYDGQRQTGESISRTGTGAQTALQASWKGESVTILEVDGREVARSTAPYMDEQLLW